MTTDIVIDLGFGDAGKGMFVDHLAGRSPETTLVVRFSGGHQVGHTVVRDGRRHTFSNFGAGSLAGVPTYYWSTTTVFPPAAQMEREILAPVEPDVFVHPLAMVTTPYDIAYNRVTERANRHGSCGVGFGATVARHQAGVALTVKDLTNRWVAGHKLAAVRAHHRDRFQSHDLADDYEREVADVDPDRFIDVSLAWLRHVTLALPDDLPGDRPDLVLEGNQGILLDQVHGIFPHVTRADTTSAPTLDVLDQLAGAGFPIGEVIDIHSLTRCYQTRHGNGPMSSAVPVGLRGADDEANTTNEFQGAFRTAELDVALLDYALATDAAHHDRRPSGTTIRRHLVITCLDQRPEFDIDRLVRSLDTEFESIRISHGPDAATVARFPAPQSPVRETGHSLH